MKKLPFIFVVLATTASGQSSMSPKDEICVESAKTYSMLIEKKAVKVSEAELLEVINRTTLPLAQKSRLQGMAKLLDGSEIRNKTNLVQNFYLKCSAN